MCNSNDWFGAEVKLRVEVRLIGTVGELRMERERES